MGTGEHPPELLQPWSKPTSPVKKKKKRRVDVQPAGSVRNVQDATLANSDSLVGGVILTLSISIVLFLH